MCLGMTIDQSPKCIVDGREHLEVIGLRANMKIYFVIF